MLWLRGVPAQQAVLPECPDVPDSRDGILRRLRDVVRVRLAGRCRQRQYVVEREDVQGVQPGERVRQGPDASTAPPSSAPLRPSG